jgi:DNA-binding IclR family transcriptional regulator
VGQPSSEDKLGLSSVRNALSVLSMLSDGVELRVVDVARALDVAVSTAHRLLSTLVDERFLRQAPGSRRYIAGPVALRLARAISFEQTLRRIAEPYLQLLCRELNETINLEILVDGDVYFLASAEDRHQLRVAQFVGQRIPAHQAAGGKVLLAFGSAAAPEVPSGTSASAAVASAAVGEDLAAELRQVRAAAYAVNLSDIDDSVRAVAVPVRDAEGECLAALSLAAPTVRLPDLRVQYVLPELRRAADEIATTYAGAARRVRARAPVAGAGGSS